MNTKVEPKQPAEPQLHEVLEKYQEVFRGNLPLGLPPERYVDHEIETPSGATPPLRPLYQISPAEMSAVKDYVTGLMKNGNIRPSRSPYGAPIFFVKHKGKLRAVTDYRALNRITKQKNVSLPRSDEMFNRLREATCFSKMELKVCSH